MVLRFVVIKVMPPIDVDTACPSGYTFQGLDSNGEPICALGNQSDEVGPGGVCQQDLRFWVMTIVVIQFVGMIVKGHD